MSFSIQKFNDIYDPLSARDRAGEEQRLLKAFGQVVVSREVQVAIRYEARGLKQASFAAQRFDLQVGYDLACIAYIHIRDVEIPDAGDRVNHFAIRADRLVHLIWNILNETDTVFEWLSKHSALRRAFGAVEDFLTPGELIRLIDSIEGLELTGEVAG